MEDSLSALQNVDLVEFNNKKIYLVGTAHISQSSVDLAERVIREVHPDTVAVELCSSRYASLKDPERWKNTDIVSVIKSGRIYVLMAQLVLAGFQKKLGNQLNIKPGAEMMRSIQIAEEINCATVLADRDVRTTLKRTWAALGFFTSIKLIFSMVLSVFSREKISEKEIEELKSSASLDLLMKEFSEKMPQIRKPLIDERDQYLAAKIKEAPGNSIVAIVGAGHIPGIKSLMNEEINLIPLEEIPPKTLRSKLLGWSVPGLVIAIILYGFFGSGAETSYEMIEAWFLITGIAGALGSAIAMAHPLTILSAFLATPLATLHPLVAAGWIAGLVEAWVRKPRVSDFETIVDDMSSLRGIWHNRVSRILLIVALTNLTATAGMIWGAKVLAGLAFVK